MKILTGLVFLGLSFSAFAADDITVVALNDFHGQVQPNKNMVGAAKIATFLAEYQKSHPHLILVSAGDNYQGTAISNISKGQVVNEIFNYLGMSYSAIGNHEFDYGLSAFNTWEATNKFPFLAANIIEAKTGKVFKYASPYGITTMDNKYKVAFIGLSTLETPDTTLAENVKGLKFTNPAQTANRSQFRSKYARAPGYYYSTHSYSGSAG